MSLKSYLVRAMGSNALLWIGDRYFANSAPIFMMHRFACREFGIEGHDLADVRFALDYLRKQRFNLVSVADIAMAVRTRSPLPPRSVAFSIDDGYWDHTEIPMDLFVAYDCPVTYFVTTGFVNQELWLWDSKVEFIVDQVAEEHIPTLGSMFPAIAAGNRTRSSIARIITFELAKSALGRIEESIDQIARSVDISIPIAAPDKYRATTWSRLRQIQEFGMRVAPHSFSHPILANESTENSRFEMQKSRDDLLQNLPSSDNVFCYPVGRPQDFGEREQKTARELGFDGAVSASPPSVDLNDQSALYSLPRFSFPNQRTDFVQYATWIESFKNSIRSRKRPGAHAG